MTPLPAPHSRTTPRNTHPPAHHFLQEGRCFITLYVDCTERRGPRGPPRPARATAGSRGVGVMGGPAAVPRRVGFAARPANGWGEGAGAGKGGTGRGGGRSDGAAQPRAAPRRASQPAMAAEAEAEEKGRRRRGAQTAVSSSRTARIRRRRGRRGEDGAAAAGPQIIPRRIRIRALDPALLATVPDQDSSILALLAAAQSLARGSLVGSAGSAQSKKSVDFGSLGAGSALSSPGPCLLEGEHQPACRELPLQTGSGNQQ